MMTYREMLWRVLKVFSARQFTASPVRLSMNLLVKNEADIIADNIRFHSQLGVDCFVVMDNGSNDGTLETVEELKKDYDIHLLSRPVLDYQQSNWKSEMAFISRDLLKADWSIANDADEFWLPEGDSLKAELSRFGSTIYCPRVNMQLDYRFHEDDFDFADLDLMVKYPIFFKGVNLQQEENIPIQLGKITGKVIACNHGLVRIHGGNHRAKHFFKKLSHRECSSIKVLHYPIRSKSHFTDHIENRAKLLASNEKVKMGDHYRRWVKFYQENRLEEEFNRLVLSDNDIEVLTKFGVVERVPQISRRMRELLGRAA